MPRCELILLLWQFYPSALSVMRRTAIELGELRLRTLQRWEILKFTLHSPYVFYQILLKYFYVCIK